MIDKFILNEESSVEEHSGETHKKAIVSGYYVVHYKWHSDIMFRELIESRIMLKAKNVKAAINKFYRLPKTGCVVITKVVPLEVEVE